MGAWFYAGFAELIIAGIAYDALFGMTRQAGIWGWMGTIVSIALYGGVLVAKEVIRK